MKQHIKMVIYTNMNPIINLL
uniref:Uncharacterized protein n=1 Tax=Anguilla anguilla TaxID=7936 RepID=A0A0E9URN0_ANGAN